MTEQLCVSCSEKPATTKGPTPLCPECADKAKGKERGVEVKPKETTEPASP